MDIVVYSLFWVMQDLYHQQYTGTPKRDPHLENYPFPGLGSNHFGAFADL